MLPSESMPLPIGGYDFLIYYDPTALMVTDVDEGKFFTDCDWEYFTYRFGPYGNCGSACPEGYLRIVAMAEQNDGANHPDCFTNDGVGNNPGPGTSTSSELAVISMLVTSDFTYECQFVPVRFVWYDCGDNTFSNVAGDTLLTSLRVFDYLGEEFEIDTHYEITDTTANFPSFTGANSECDVFTDKGEPFRGVNFWNGGIDIVCKDSIDAPGDININGVAYEIADAVMFTRYFIVGEAAFVMAPLLLPTVTLTVWPYLLLTSSI